MHKDHHLASGHDNVGCTREVAPMQSKAITSGEQQPPNLLFGQGVFPFDAGHHPATHGWGNDVGHQSVFKPLMAQMGLSSGMFDAAPV